MTTLRVGLSGCHTASLELVQRCRDVGDVAIVAVHDDDGDALAAFQATAKLGVATTSFDALLGTGVDFVVLAGPPASHPARVAAAAAQAAHCLVTAPFAVDFSAAQTIAATAAEAGIRVGVLAPELEDPVVEQIRRMIADDWLGGIVAVQGMLGDDRALHGSGPRSHPFVELTARQLHLASWLVGRRALRVTAQTLHTFSRDEDAGVATAVLRGNVACTFTASHATNVRVFAVHGTDGGVRLAGDRVWLLGRSEFRGEVFDYLSPGHELSLSRADLAPQLAPRAARANLVGRFARWLEDVDDYPCPIEQGLDDLRVVDAMLRAAHGSGSETIAWPS